MGERGCVGNFFLKKGKKTERTYETREDKKVGHVCVFFCCEGDQVCVGEGGLCVCVGGVIVGGSNREKKQDCCSFETEAHRSTR